MSDKVYFWMCRHGISEFMVVNSFVEEISTVFPLNIYNYFMPFPFHALKSRSNCHLCAASKYIMLSLYVIIDCLLSSNIKSMQVVKHPSFQWSSNPRNKVFHSLAAVDVVGSAINYLNQPRCGEIPGSWWWRVKCQGIRGASRHLSSLDDGFRLLAAKAGSIRVLLGHGSSSS